MHPPGVRWITPPQCLPQCGQVRYHENKPFHPQIPPQRKFSQNAEKNQTRHGFFWTEGSQQGVGHSLLKRPREKEQLSERWILGKQERTWQQSDRKLSLADTEGRMLHSAATKSRQPRIHRDLWTSKFEKTPCPPPPLPPPELEYLPAKVQDKFPDNTWNDNKVQIHKAPISLPHKVVTQANILIPKSTVFQNWRHIFVLFWL